MTEREALAASSAAPEPWAWAVLANPGESLANQDGDSVDHLIFWDEQAARDRAHEDCFEDDEPLRVVPLYPASPERDRVVEAARRIAAEPDFEPWEGMAELIAALAAMDRRETS